MYPVKLVGPRVTLREFRADDVDAAFALVGDDSVTRWLSFDSRTRDQAAAMIDGGLPPDAELLARPSACGELAGAVRRGQ